MVTPAPFPQGIHRLYCLYNLTYSSCMVDSLILLLINLSILKIYWNNKLINLTYRGKKGIFYSYN